MSFPRLRLALPFLLLIATLCAAVGFLVRSARMAAGLTGAGEAVSLRRQAGDSLVSALLTASAQGESATLRFADDAALARYLRATARVDSALQHMLGLTPDSVQRQRLDTLRGLVSLRREGVVRLIAALREESRRGTSLESRISALRSGDKAVNVAATVPTAVVKEGEQVVISRRRKGFFRRLGDAFRGAKDDTIHVRTTHTEQSADTARTHVNVSGSLADILSDVDRDLDRRTSASGRRIARHSDRLRTADLTLTTRLTALLAAYGRAERRQLEEATAADLAMRRSGARRMGALALVATLIATGFFVRILRDIRREARYRRELEEANERTEALMERREQLLLTISHDIKAPVHAILGYLALIPPDEGGSDRRTKLAAIRTSAAHLQALVTALLDYHKLEAGELHPTLAPTDLHRLLEEVITTFIPQATEKGLKLTAEDTLPADYGHYVTDAFRLRQVLDNLVSNAVKYTRRGSVTLTASVRDECLQLRVSDTGCGLSEADRRRVFEPFTRVKGSEGQEGSGLGLSITRRLAELLGGTLSLESRLGEGSAFTLSLPARSWQATAEGEPVTDEENEQGSGERGETADDSQAEVLQAEAGGTGAGGTEAGGSEAGKAATSPSAAPPALPFTPTCIALIDDDPLQLQLTVAMLRNVLPAGMVLLPHTTPDALFETLTDTAQARPDLVMTDIEMPALTGFDVLRRLRTIPGCEALPVVAMTAHSLLPPTHFTEQGFASVVFKPFTQNDLRLLFPQTEKKADTGRTQTTPAPPGALQGAAPATAPAAVPSASTATALSFAPLLVFAAGDAAAEGQIMEQFRTDCRTRLTALRTAAEGHDKTALCQLAHKLLPVFTMIGSPAVPTLRDLEARRSETQWTAADAEACRTVNEALEAALKAAANR